MDTSEGITDSSYINQAQSFSGSTDSRFIFPLNGESDEAATAASAVSAAAVPSSPLYRTSAVSPSPPGDGELGANGTEAEIDFIPDLYFSFAPDEQHHRDEAACSDSIAKSEEAARCTFASETPKRAPSTAFTPAPVFQAAPSPCAEQALRSLAKPEEEQAGLRLPVRILPERDLPSPLQPAEPVKPPQPLLPLQPPQPPPFQKTILDPRLITSFEEPRSASQGPADMAQPLISSLENSKQLEIYKQASRPLFPTSLRNAVVENEETFKSLVHDFIDYVIDENRAKICIPRTADFGDVGGFGLGQYNPNYPPSFDEYQKVISPVPQSGDFPTQSFINFVRDRGFSLPSHAESLISSKGRLQNLYNLGAMQVLVRHIDPSALQDARDEPLYSEIMDINQIYHAYHASAERQKPMLAITDSSHDHRRGEEASAEHLALLAHHGMPRITKPEAPRPLKPSLDKKQQADMMECPPPPTLTKRFPRERSRKRREEPSRPTETECVILAPSPRNDTPSVKLGQDYVILCNRIYDVCQETDDDASKVVEEEEEEMEEEVVEDDDDDISWVGAKLSTEDPKTNSGTSKVLTEDGKKAKRLKGLKDAAPVAFKREQSFLDLSSNPAFLQKSGNSHVTLNQSIIRNLDRIICQVKAQRKEQLSTRMKGGEFGFISLGIVRNPPKGSEKVLTHRFNMERKYAERRKKPSPSEVKIEVEDGKEVLVLSPRAPYGMVEVEEEEENDDSVVFVASMSKRPRRRRGSGPVAKRGRRSAAAMDPCSKEASDGLKRTVKERMLLVESRKREAKAGGKNFYGTGSYMDYEDGDESEEEIIPTPKKRGAVAEFRAQNADDVPEEEGLVTSGGEVGLIVTVEDFGSTTGERSLGKGKAPARKAQQSKKGKGPAKKGKGRGRKSKSPDPGVVEAVEELVTLVVSGIERYEVVGVSDGGEGEKKTGHLPVGKRPRGRPKKIKFPKVISIEEWPPAHELGKEIEDLKDEPSFFQVAVNDG